MPGHITFVDCVEGIHPAARPKESHHEPKGAEEKKKHTPH